MRQRGERIEQHGSLGEISARQLSNHEVMGPNLRLLKQFHQRGVAPTQVIYPN
ncbi:MAG TPA: hypothetical protein VJ738_04980 [Steroidobacteraceae bacterium]|nr:hypothetical protein [Steroidobacteraceae bacterium]